jgi:rsbT co-antagonist protein RsbR
MEESVEGTATEHQGKDGGGGRVALNEMLRKHRTEILSDWIDEQSAPGVIREDLIRRTELRDQCEEFLQLVINALESDDRANIRGDAFEPVRDFLIRLSRARSERGFSPSETASFVFSLKRPLFTRLRKDFDKDQKKLLLEIWSATQLLDSLGLVTMEAYQKAREEVIARQQSELLELSTPVVKLWDGILALPMIGTLDSNRTQVVMETLLQRIVETGSQIAIIDITGVPTVDTLVAQHLMKTVAAARLMGVDCIISGIRPQIAQTIVHLAVDLGEVVTKASLADAFRLALQRLRPVEAGATPLT